MPALNYSRRWHQAGASLLLIALTAAVVPSLPFWELMQHDELNFGDKILHVLAFVVLSLWYSGLYEKRHYPGVALALVTFGALIEILQSFISYRTAEWMDLLADSAGITVGIVVALLGFGSWTQRVEQWLDRRHE